MNASPLHFIESGDDMAEQDVFGISFPLLNDAGSGTLQSSELQLFTTLSIVQLP